jgi:hypothetical protein
MKLSAIFKEKLNESDWSDEHARLTIQEMKDWCKDMKIQDARVAKEGKEFVINVTGDVRIRADDLPLDDDNMAYIPYQFGEVEGNFIIIGNGREKLRSLKNGPFQVYGYYSAANLGLESLDGMAGSVGNQCNLSHNRLTSWDGIPSQCGTLSIFDNRITSFKGISKNWLMGNELEVDGQVCGCALELLDIEGLETVTFNSSSMGNKNQDELDTVAEILERHLQGDRNPIDMQSDFIDADLTDWIKSKR